MEAAELLADAIGRIQDLVHQVADGSDADQLARSPGPGANTIGWLLWHLTRVQDMHVAEFLDAEQIYVAGGHAVALGRPADPADSGYGHTAEQMAAVQPPGPGPLLTYHDAVVARSLDLLLRVGPADLDEVVDRRWDPPVTAGVRWVSIVSDCLQHAGQAAYARGLVVGPWHPTG